MSYISVMNFIIPSIVCYIIGSIPCGVIVAAVFKLGDLQKQGSGNIGGTNVARVGGKALGMLTITLDVLKGVVAMSVVQKVPFSEVSLAIMGLITVVGNVCPIWLRFRGGKGVATTVGVLIVLNPHMAATFASTWLISFASSGVSSLSSILAVLLSFTWCCFASPTEVVLVYAALFGLILYRHKGNIYRLLHKKENRL